MKFPDYNRPGHYYCYYHKPKKTNYEFQTPLYEENNTQIYGTFNLTS